MYLNSLKPLAKTGSPLRAAELHGAEQNKIPFCPGHRPLQKPENLSLLALS
jgi:hypothetical protein